MMKYIYNNFTVLPTSEIKVGSYHLKGIIGGWCGFSHGLGSLRAGLDGSFGVGISVILYSTKSNDSSSADDSVELADPKDTKFIKPLEHDCFFDEDTSIQYTRTFAKWKCLNCRKKWYSAFSWISLTFAENNQKTCKDTTKIFDSSSQKWTKKTNIVFDGSNLKKEEFLSQNCKNCLMIDKVKITSYSNLAKPALNNSNDPIKPHREDLCAKCQKGHLCTKNHY